MKAIICDKCKKVVSDKSELDHVETIDFSNQLIGHFYSVNLCKECQESFDKMFSDWIKN